MHPNGTKEQITKNTAVLQELEAGNTAGGDVFPETQSEIDRLKAQIAQSELIVAAYEKDIAKRLSWARREGQKWSLLCRASLGSPRGS